MALRFTILTRNAIRVLTKGERITEHGITVERTSKGDLRYSVNIMVDGQRIHRAVGCESDGTTREQAERAIETFRTKAREGRLDLPTGRKLHRSFAEAAEEYVGRMESTDGKDMVNKRRHLRTYLIPYFRDRRLDQLTEFRLKQYRRKRSDDGATDATINREFSTLKHMLNRAVDWRWMTLDRKPKIEQSREARKQIRVLTEQQCRALMNAAHADQDDRLWLFVAFGLGAAMRHSEIVRARYEDVDFDTRRLWIDRAKAGEREQPITPSLANALRRQRAMENDQGGWIFPAMRASKQAHRRDMRGGFQRAVERAGLDPTKVTPHIMRHTAITRLVQANTDIPTIQRISGHKTTAMVLHYAHVHGTHIDAAISALDDGLGLEVTQKLHAPNS
ncbi:tyrosine-type recombinase/integrase [uncultured Sphingomonas sp.]|uniref:tyrosine-type recombinase/integrase n=1 Tax=uncultured Sphingomonas sp. TaxID=158754 RepID=UPI0035CA0108